MTLKNYQLLDSGNLTKLEQVGKYRIVRPALNAFWKPALASREWNDAHAVFERNSSGGGKWRKQNGGLPESWEVEYSGFNILVKPTNFGHLGFFAEQYENWDWLKKTIGKMQGEPQVLNLFAYSGLGSLAMAEGGAKVCHVDAAQGMNEWGRQILQLNPRIDDRIRWIADDVVKFTARETRRGVKYNGLILDPPSFGRGPKGQLWKIEDNLDELMCNCRELIDTDKPFFVILSCHSPGFSPLVLEHILQDYFGAGNQLESGEMTIPAASGHLLPAGVSAKIWKS
ncbi:MAG: class I SAM-dependent methyltransferase [Victivallaceae bacterium]|nr:class I SAM-dependent methyltransferase [Victivallaceae bacterium]MDD3116630.1 class I SAM-dependent methyltransferase [Victivallaceae bacterium]MDD3703762.1 class I SAM-dependent methyltransferase [Victivallaceae bacterium]MDD4318657.1 class I SAM-dependent methyltransferase [Victivallaceae bacterium]NLK83025.1 hypothetical protein [Lentisphaerota bacterium]